MNNNIPLIKRNKFKGDDKEFLLYMVNREYEKCKDKYKIHIGKKSIRYHCNLSTKTIYVDYMIFSYDEINKDVAIEFLHEIGHLRTNKIGMFRWKEEYLATEWAFKRWKQYGLEVPEWMKKEYNTYINRFKSRGYLYQEELDMCKTTKEKEAFIERYKPFV